MNLRPALAGRSWTAALASSAVAFLATAVAAAPWLRAFPEGTVVPVLLGAAACSVLPAPLLGRWAKRSASWSFGIGLLALLTYCLVVVLGQPDQPALLGDGLTRGLSRLLSTQLPVTAPRYLLVPPALLTWCTGAVTAELSTREPTSAAPALCWPTSFALAYAATAGAPGEQLGWALALLGLVGVFLVLAREVTGRGLTSPTRAAGRGRRRTLVLAGASLGGAGLLGALAVPALPGLRATPVTPGRQAPVQQSHPLTPTAAVVELRAERSRALFQVVADRAVPGYLTFADLDAYDGNTWSLSATFLPTGGRVPPAAGSPVAPTSQLVLQHYQVLAGTGLPWMPYLSAPVSISGLPVSESSLAGMVLPTSPLSRGQGYAVVSGPVAPTLSSLAPELAALRPGGTPDAQDGLVPPDETPDLDDVTTLLSQQTGQSTVDPIAFLGAVERQWQDHYRRVAGSGTGSSGAVNDTTFADVVNAVLVDRKATPEQFATLFALLARHLGVPARLVTGFRLAGPGQVVGTAAPGRTYTVTSREAWTWVQISIAGLGWVLVDPTPQRSGAPVLPTYSTAPSSTTTSQAPVQAVTVPTDSGHAVAPPVSVDLRPQPAGGSWLALLIGVSAGVVLAGLAGLLARKRRRRRRRRRAPEPSSQVVGAWLEALDTLEEATLGGLAPLTGEEVVGAAGQRFGPAAADRLRAVAEHASVALFSPETPLGPEGAARAWQELDELRRLVRRALPLRVRLLAALRFAQSERHQEHPALRSGAGDPAASPAAEAVSGARRPAPPHRPGPGG